MKSDRLHSYFDYSYPLGYSISVGNDNKIIRNLYLSSNLYFKHNKAKMYYNSAGGNAPYVDYTSNYIRLSSLLGIKIFNSVDLLVGIDIGRRINVNIDIQSEGENCWHLKPDYIPNFDYALCYGIGKHIKIGNMNYIIEMEYFDGLTEYKFCSDEEGCIPNPTKNQGLQLELGYRF